MKMSNNNNVIQVNTEDQYDNCVSCGETTSFSKGHSIEGRLWYVEGAGQLCGSCYKREYDKIDD